MLGRERPADGLGRQALAHIAIGRDEFGVVDLDEIVACRRPVQNADAEEEQQSGDPLKAIRPENGDGPLLVVGGGAV
jgi:hypothetical protein